MRKRGTSTKSLAYRLVDLISRNALASVHLPTTEANAHRLITIFANQIKSTSRYASGYEEQSAFELFFTMSIAAVLYNEKSIDMNNPG